MLFIDICIYIYICTYVRSLWRAARAACDVCVHVCSQRSCISGSNSKNRKLFFTRQLNPSHGMNCEGRQLNQSPGSLEGLRQELRGCKDEDEASAIFSASTLRLALSLTLASVFSLLSVSSSALTVSLGALTAFEYSSVLRALFFGFRHPS